MNQQSIPKFLEQARLSQVESPLSERHKQSLQLKRWQIVSASLILLLAGVGIGRFEPKSESNHVSRQTQVKPLPVKTTQIQPAKTYQTVQSYTGEVVPMLMSEVGFERGGKIVTVLVDEGDRVTIGTVLARLDTRNLQAQRQSSIAQKA